MVEVLDWEEAKAMGLEKVRGKVVQETVDLVPMVVKLITGNG